jgi:hypothetical protein
VFGTANHELPKLPSLRWVLSYLIWLCGFDIKFIAKTVYRNHIDPIDQEMGILHAMVFETLSGVTYYYGMLVSCNPGDGFWE